MTRPTLDMVMARRRKDVAERKSLRTLETLEGMLAGLPAPRGLGRALLAAARRPAVIAELKKASPSGGLLREDFDAGDLAEDYAKAGASALSVLTEEAFFQGELANLGRARCMVELPILQKDFIFDPYQIVEARVFGADAVLLIAAILRPEQLEDLAEVASKLGLDALIEVHNEEELERALAIDATLIGINNRDLKTYEIDLTTTARLIQVMGDRRTGRIVVGESGIRTAQDVAQLLKAGVDAVLVGEAMMRAPDLGVAYARLFESPTEPSAGE